MMSLDAVRSVSFCRRPELSIRLAQQALAQASPAPDARRWLRSQLSLLLVCGQGQWEDTTGALDSTLRFAERLRDKEIRHELDLWGHDVPHDWPSWRAQIAHHLPRFC